MSERVVWASPGEPLLEVVRRDDGNFHLREQSGREGVVVIAERPDGRILLGLHPRPAVEDELWELPRGFGESGDAAADGLRELREETGYTAATGRVLGRLYPNSGLLASAVPVVLVSVDPVPVEQTDGEMRELRWFTRAELRELLRGDAPVDGLTAAAFAMLTAHEKT